MENLSCSFLKVFVNQNLRPPPNKFTHVFVIFRVNQYDYHEKYIKWPLSVLTRKPAVRFIYGGN